MIDHCPACGTDGVSGRAWLYAYWPLYTTCSHCGVRLRRHRNSIWLDLFCQLVGSTLISVAVVTAVFGMFWVAVSTFVISMILFFLPYKLGPFVPIRKPGNAAS